MNGLFKFIWRCIKAIILRKNNVRLSPMVRFNNKTIFEGNNVVYAKATVGNSIIGRNTYIGPNSYMVNCIIGRFCSISADVQVIDATHPSSVFVSTCPSFYSINKQNGQSFVKKNKFDERLLVDGKSAIIGNDVWIGTNVTIKGGIRIGDGAIVAMGSVVTKDVPPYAIVGGIPAHIIKYRFNPEQIIRLNEIQWWNQSDSWIKAHAEDFENIECFINSIKE